MIINSWDENTPSGLQLRFFLVAARELAWRGGERAACLTHHFKKELDNSGMPTGRFEYNSIFSKTYQGGAHRLADSKWLIPNVEDPNICPVRLSEKMLSKRGPNIKTDRLFLTENPFWNKPNGNGWFKNCPAGINEIAKWTKQSAEKRIKVTNHSTRSTAVTKLAKAGVSEQELIKITGHSNAAAIRPYLQIDHQHHANIIDKLRNQRTEGPTNTSSASNIASAASLAICTITEESISSNVTKEQIVYNNCQIYHYH